MYVLIVSESDADLAALQSWLSESLPNLRKERKGKKGHVAIHSSFKVHKAGGVALVYNFMPPHFKIHVPKQGMFGLNGSCVNTEDLPSVFLIIIPACASHKTLNTQFDSHVALRLMQAEETKHQTRLIWLGLACFISQMENPDYVVTFYTPLPDLRIALMKGSKEYFAIVYSVISHFGNRGTNPPPLRAFSQICDGCGVTAWS